MDHTPNMSAEASRPPNAEQVRSATYTLASLDQDFLLGDSMRGVRFMLEYEKAEEFLRSWGVRSNDTHASTSDPDSRLYRKAAGR